MSVSLFITKVILFFSCCFAIYLFFSISLILLLFKRLWALLSTLFPWSQSPPAPFITHHLSLEPVLSPDTALPTPLVLGCSTVPSQSWLIPSLQFQLQISYCVTLSFSLKPSLLEQGEAHKRQEANGTHRSDRIHQASSWRLETQGPVAGRALFCGTACKLGREPQGCYPGSSPNNLSIGSY